MLLLLVLLFGAACQQQPGGGVSGRDGQLRFVTRSLPDAYVGEPYSAALRVEGARGRVTWKLDRGDLPPGLTLGGGSGRITGTPLAEGSYRFTVAARDATGARVSAGVTLRVSPGLCDGVRMLCVDGARGDDGYTGTSARPLKTIREALERAEPGSTVYVRAGVYHEQVALPRSGAEGAPIVLQGERGPDGEWLTVLRPGPLTAEWTPAPEVGAGVFKSDDLPFEPFALTVQDGDAIRDIPRIGNDKDNWRSVLATPADKVVDARWLDFRVRYWDGIEALYAYRDGITYLRFRDGDDPNTKTLFASPGHNDAVSSQLGAAFALIGRSHIVVRDFAIEGWQVGVLLHGSGAAHNVIERNRIVNGQRRIAVVSGARLNHVRDNELGTRWLGPYRPGAWQGADYVYDESDPEAYPYAVKQHIYWTFKQEVGFSTYSPHDDGGIFVGGAGPDNRIYRNHIHDMLGGIFGSPAGRLYVYENVVHNTSSIALLVDERVTAELYIYDNLVYDANHGFRVQLNNPNPDYLAKRVWFYRNKIFNPKRIGTALYMSRTPDRADPPSSDGYPRIFIYHNSFSGGTVITWVENVGSHVVLVNNVFSGMDFYSHGSVGVFGYNWLNGGTDNFSYATGSGTNVETNYDDMWPSDELPDFTLPDDPKGRSAMEAGVDVSASFTVGGRSFAALPGMEPGYFSGSAPDLGAVQR